jgi:hypothetical protein
VFSVLLQVFNLNSLLQRFWQCQNYFAGSFEDTRSFCKHSTPLQSCKNSDNSKNNSVRNLSPSQWIQARQMLLITFRDGNHYVAFLSFNSSSILQTHYIPCKSTRSPIQSKSRRASPLIHMVSPVSPNSTYPHSFASLLSTVQAFQIFRHSLDWGPLWNDSLAVTRRR